MIAVIRYIFIFYICVGLFSISCSPSASSDVFEQPNVGGDDKEEQEEDDVVVGGVPTATHSIAALRALYLGGSHIIKENIVIAGQVVANDLRGELTSAVVIQDESGAIEVSIDLSDVWQSYELGCWVRLVCDNLWFGSGSGALVVGREPTGNSAVDMISERDLATRLYRVEAGAMPAGRRVTLVELNKSMLSTLVTIDDLSFDEAGVALFCDRDPVTGRAQSTTHILRDVNGLQITLYVPYTLSYANGTLPEGCGSVTGILQYVGGYSLLPVDRCFIF